jgi:hypothetical protein
MGTVINPFPPENLNGLTTRRGGTNCPSRVVMLFTSQRDTSSAMLSIGKDDENGTSRSPIELEGDHNEQYMVEAARSRERGSLRCTRILEEWRW